jgi:RNA polymerase subunit RPABC4/transcription elongation factor Spt4
MKKTKHYWICKGEKDEHSESNCGKVFFNDDDNVCRYCGSKNTQEVHLDIKIIKD